jgi:hypothetical protein
VSRSDERAAENEVIFRRANEEIDQRRRELDVDGRTPYICECENERCTHLIRLTLDEYQRIRSSRRQFLIADGHPYRDGRIVEDRGDWIIVEKQGVGGTIADRTAE